MSKQTYLTVAPSHLPPQTGFVLAIVEGELVGSVVVVEMNAVRTPILNTRLYRTRTAAKKALPTVAASLGLSFV